MSKIISLDIETIGLTPWAKDSEIISIGLAWRNDAGEMQTYFTKGFQNIEAVLSRLAETQDKILVYNQSFEMRWFNYYWPHLQLNWLADVMRLVQLHGTSSDNANMTVEIDGFGLKPAVTRILGKLPTAAEEIYGWIHSNYKTTKAQAGQYLATAPDDILERYNLEDSIYTLELYEHLTAKFDRIKFDWTRDQDIYQGVVKELVSANLAGFPVDIGALTQYVKDIDAEVLNIDRTFAIKYQQEILNVRELLRQKEQAKFKKKIVTELPEFNIGSRHHLELLFCGQLGLKASFETAKGSPSFKSSHMSSWGEPGGILANRGKRLIIQNQVKALLRAAGPSGIWRPEVKAVGTVTGRLAGSSGVNYQGWSRSDKPFMEAVKARPGHVFLEQDFVSGEPTIIAAYTNDPVYMYHTFTGKGHRPYYDANGLLWIDDAYIATMSVSGQGTKELKQLFDTELFNGLTFAEQWVKDPEVVKAHPVIKKWRKLNKMLALAMGYGMGAKKLVKQVKEQFNIEVQESQAKQVIKGYWKMYAKVKQYAERCSFRVEQTGYIVNQFGFRITPSPHKAFNATIQSTLSGVVNWRLLLLRERCDWFTLVGIIHDSLVMEIPKNRVEEFHKISDEVDDYINEQLQWSVKIKTGRNVGENFYEIK